MTWTVILIDEVDDWYTALAQDDPASADAVEAAIDLLEQEGPTLGRPTVDRIEGSRVHTMNELRPKATSIRVLFVFDPERQAVLVVAGDKAGDWTGWYDDNVPVAEARYEKWLRGHYSEERS